MRWWLPFVWPTLIKQTWHWLMHPPPPPEPPKAARTTVRKYGKKVQ